MLRGLIDESGPIDPATDRRGSRPDPYEALARAIVGQQLSTKAAGSIWERLVAHFGGSFPQPAQLLAADPESLREAGLSWAKVGFLRDLAERIEDGNLTWGGWQGSRTRTWWRSSSRSRGSARGRPRCS